MRKISAAQQRTLDNATLIAALQLIFISLEKAHFPLYKLEEIADTTSGGTPDRSRSEYYEGDIPWIKSGELNDGIIQNCEEYITEEGLKNSSAKIYPKDTLVVALYGATVGKTGILDFEAASNQAVCAIFPKQNDISQKFIFWFLRHKRPEFLQKSFGGAQPNISQKVLRSTTLHIPSIELQEIICSYLEIIELRQRGIKKGDLPLLPEPLSHINTAIAKFEQVAAKVEEARGLRREAVEEMENVMFSATHAIFENLDKQQKANSVPLNQVTKIFGGGTPSKANYEFWQGAIPWVSPKDMKVSDIYDSEDHISELALETGASMLVPQNSMLVVVRSGILRRTLPIAINRVPVTINQDMKALVPSDILSCDFLAWWFRSKEDTFLEHVKGGTTVQSLVWDNVSKTHICVPSPAEQHQIVTYLQNLQAKVDILKHHQTETSAELDALLPSILDKAFKGEL